MVMGLALYQQLSRGKIPHLAKETLLGVVSWRNTDSVILQVGHALYLGDMLKTCLVLARS